MIAVRDRLGGEMKKTLVGCLALLGEDARPSDGPVDIVIEGKVIREIRPSGARKPAGAVIDLSGRLVTAGLINGHHHSHQGAQGQPAARALDELCPPAQTNRFLGTRDLLADDDRRH